MALSLVEAAKLSNDVLYKGIVEYLYKESPILQNIKWKDIVGNAFTYNRYTAHSSVQWRGVNQPWNRVEPGTWTQYTATTKILGGQIPLDNYLKVTRSDHIDLRAELLAEFLDSMRKEFTDSFYYGSSTTNPLQFDGTHVLMTSSTYNTIVADSGDSAVVPLSLSTHLDAAIDMFKSPNKPQMIVSTRALKRGATKALRAVGGVQMTKDNFGNQIESYAGIPWYADDHLLETELTSSGAFSAKTGGYTTTVWLFNFEDKGIEGCQSSPITTIPWRTSELFNGEVCDVYWYPSIMMMNLLSSVKIVGIDADGTVTV